MSVSLYGSGQTVIQVVNGTLSTDFSTSSTTPVSTGLTATITPQSTTSKILIIINTVVSANGSTYGGGAFAIYKNGSSIYTDPTGNNALYGAANIAAPQARITLTYLDSPSTTSATTYTLYGFSRSGGTMDVSYSNSISTITLMEISQS
jgi:hypothetical protein